jgi:dTDP-4-amino-4,6-dideoxygalactose transaminase
VRIPLSVVEMGAAEEAAVLEDAFARLHGTAYAVAVSNGTVALVAARRAGACLGISTPFG